MPESQVHAHSRQAPPDARAALAVAETMQALATPSRVRLLYALRDEELSVGELAEAVGLAPAAASQQLRILRQLRLVASRRDGQSIRYRLHDEHTGILLDEIRNHVEHATRGWESPPPSKQGQRTGTARARAKPERPAA
jgi:ArsR family transcriptional regulator, nickel/cobalt-responsive transcriptional repressor